ncbi:hypothetical protein ABZ864_47975 [Streptomyces sp. NPDC047082]|uniref:hypothetical protein n=1 Tax=Streptomyces sp. NPDC047082 TaxID=3155259 RepID=UPI0033F5D94D
MEWFRRDRPDQRWQLQHSENNGRSWKTKTAFATAPEARLAVTDGSRDPVAAHLLLSEEQGLWLYSRENAALAAGLSADRAQVQAFRDWALQADGGLPPPDTIEKYDAAAGRTGLVPDVLADVRIAAGTAVMRAIAAAAEGRALSPQDHERHWMALAACGASRPARSIAHWHLEQAVQASPVLRRVANRLREAGAKPRETELLTAVVLTLHAAGRTQQAEQLVDELETDPRRLIRAVSDEGAYSQALVAQELLATVTARQRLDAPLGTGADHAAALVARAVARLEALVVVPEAVALPQDSGLAGRIAAFAERLQEAVRVRAALLSGRGRTAQTPQAPQSQAQQASLEAQHHPSHRLGP